MTAPSDSQFPPSHQHLTANLALRFVLGCLLLVTTLTACGTGIASPSATSTKSSSVQNGTSDPCQIISLAEFTQVVGSPVTKVDESTTHTPAAQKIVICNYLPSKLPGSGGAIDFALSDDGMTYYANLKKEEASGLNNVNDVSGVGDAAFWGTETSSSDTLDFDMLTGNWVVGITITGSAADGSVYVTGAEQMAREIADKL